ncbi:hypothetical protein [Citrobacter portucalensis]|uniref:hypothetical protein n=1 Tax=Citrobacter portucalensis TaxID=1639133 RepID=UPI00333D847D
MNMELTTSGPTLNRYSLTIPSCPHKLDVERFEGLEQLSVHYHYSVRFISSIEFEL